MVKFIREVAERHRLMVGTFGHLGDGNLHPTFLTNERDTEEMHRVELALEEIVDETIRLGGTVTGGIRNIYLRTVATNTTTLVSSGLAAAASNGVSVPGRAALPDVWGQDFLFVTASEVPIAVSINQQPPRPMASLRVSIRLCARPSMGTAPRPSRSSGTKCRPSARRWNRCGATSARRETRPRRWAGT